MTLVGLSVRRRNARHSRLLTLLVRTPLSKEVIAQAQVPTFAKRGFHREVIPALDMGKRIERTSL